MGNNNHVDAIEANKKLWIRMVEEKCSFTLPWLDLDSLKLRRYADGLDINIPDPLTDIFPWHLLADVEGRNVLCLAAGGGQQSAVFGLLGAKVTVVDLVAE